MEEFVQSSGEHGVVVFSLGSMVYNLTDEKSNVIARALSQLPQKVNLLSSIKQSALVFFFFVTFIPFSKPFTLDFYLHVCWICHGQEARLCRGRWLSCLTSCSGVSLPSLPPNQMARRCVHRQKYKNPSVWKAHNN